MAKNQISWAPQEGKMNNLGGIGFVLLLELKKTVLPKYLHVLEKALNNLQNTGNAMVYLLISKRGRIVVLYLIVGCQMVYV